MLPAGVAVPCLPPFHGCESGEPLRYSLRRECAAPTCATAHRPSPAGVREIPDAPSREKSHLLSAPKQPLPLSSANCNESRRAMAEAVSGHWWQPDREPAFPAIFVRLRLVPRSRLLLRAARIALESLEASGEQLSAPVAPGGMVQQCACLLIFECSEHQPHVTAGRRTAAARFSRRAGREGRDCVGVILPIAMRSRIQKAEQCFAGNSGRIVIASVHRRELLPLYTVYRNYRSESFYLI